MVKAFAKMIVDDHTKSSMTLEDIARKKTIETGVAADPDNHLIYRLRGRSLTALWSSKLFRIIRNGKLRGSSSLRSKLADPDLHDFITSNLTHVASPS